MQYRIERATAQDRTAILAVMEPYNMHHVPSVEMEELDCSAFFVARLQDRLVGAAGYTMLSATLAKTTLLGVLPDFAGTGIGKALQQRRMEEVYRAGAKVLRTNADRPETIVWYKKHYGYREVGSLPKRCSFGLDSVACWTTLETDLDTYFASLDARLESRERYMAASVAHPLSPYPPLIINVALTGMMPTKSLTPHVPISCDEIIADAIAVADAGASIVHIHARDEQGRPTPEPAYFERIISGIRRERPDLICAATTSGRNWADFERRAAVLRLDAASRPDMASLSTGSMNFLSGASVNTIDMVERLAILMKEQSIMPELEVFDSGMVNLIKYLERNRIIEGSKYVNILLGNINTAPATIEDLAHLVRSLPPGCVWAGAGLGCFQLPVNTAAIVAGGHVRTGIEDAIHYDYARIAPATNRQLVERIARIAGELQRPLATPRQARAMLGLTQRRTETPR